MSSRLLFDPESNRYHLSSANTTEKKARCSMRCRTVFAAIILISLIIAASSIAGILLNKHKRTTTLATQVPTPITAQLQQSAMNIVDGQIICTEPSECADQTIAANHIVCFGNGTCSQSELKSSAASGTINCISDYSCFAAKLMIATGLKSITKCEAYRSCMSIANGVALSGDLLCTGKQSCYDMSYYVRAKHIQCSGEQSCASSVRYHGADDYTVVGYHADIVNCSGAWSCAFSSFYADRIHVGSGAFPIEGANIYAAKSDNISIHLEVDSSGSFGRIHCQDKATCNVHCHTEDACSDMNVYAYSNETTLNIHCHHVTCPTVWYVYPQEDDLHTDDAQPTHELDNTMVFNDNNGLNLNDEMFDVGRDWVLNGNFNFIYYQDIHKEETERNHSNNVENDSKSLDGSAIFNKVTSQLNFGEQSTTQPETSD
eukprot:230502_1